MPNLQRNVAFALPAICQQVAGVGDLAPRSAVLWPGCDLFAAVVTHVKRTFRQSRLLYRWPKNVADVLSVGRHSR